jgi:hypothetical protein
VGFRQAPAGREAVRLDLPANEAIGREIALHPDLLCSSEFPFFPGRQEVHRFIRDQAPQDAADDALRARRAAGVRTSVSAYPTVTGAIFEFGFSDAIVQMWAAFLDELARGADGMRQDFHCATPAEAAAGESHSEWALLDPNQPP